MVRIQLDGADNARDFGGTQSCNGKRIIEGRFIRSNSLCRLSAHDVRLLAEGHKVTTVIDLRTSKEIQEKPDIPLPRCTWIHIPIITEEAVGITHAQETRNRKSLLANLPELGDLYRHIVTDSYSVGQLRKALEIITAEGHEGAVLWHCTEGKDRCGLVSALFLAILDVPMDAILRDYLSTNDVAVKRARSYFHKVLFFTWSLDKARKVRRMFIAEAEYLEAALHAIAADYGSLEAFLEKGLGITRDVKERMKTAYLE